MNKRRQFIKQLSALGVLGNIPGAFAFSSTPNNEELTWHAAGKGGIVAAGPLPSAKAGIEMLNKGGNAVDSAVAIIFNLAISDFGMFSIGGEVPFMLYEASDEKVKVFNGMGGAPLDPKAIEWYYENGIPEKGIKAATVPSAISTCLTALQLKGTFSFEQVIAPTLALLDAGGQSWYANLAITLRRLIETERNTPGTREQKIEAARNRFYKGDIADELNAYYISSGGLLRKADLEAHQTVIEEPVVVDYKGYSVYKCNTWTQGAVMLQSLKILEQFDLKSTPFLSADYVHTTVEAMKLAFADRDKYYGDPAFVKVPINELLSDQYAKIRAPLIDKTKASDTIRPGDPYQMKADIGPGQYWPGEKGTTTCVVVDKWGNVVAATPSSNPEYGLCESLGISHNTRLSSLNTQKGHPNCLEPGKRPRITLTPTIILKGKKPVIAISVAGQDMQDQVSLQLFLDMVEYDMMPKEAMTATRFRTYHHEHSFVPAADPKGRVVNIGAMDINAASPELLQALTSRGHKVEIPKKVIGFAAMVYIDPVTGTLYAAAEPGRKFCAVHEKS